MAGVARACKDQTRARIVADSRWSSTLPRALHDKMMRGEFGWDVFQKHVVLPRAEQWLHPEQETYPTGMTTARPPLVIRTANWLQQAKNEPEQAA